MLELILFFVFFLIIHNLISFLGFKFGIKKLGCFSSIVVLILNVIISISISTSIVKDESNKFFDFNDSSEKNTKEEENKKQEFYSTTKKSSINYSTNKNYNYNSNSEYETNYDNEYIIDDYNDNDYNEDSEGKVRVGAICKDGTRSNSTGSGACSHHGGVAYWLYE